MQAESNMWMNVNTRDVTLQETGISCKYANANASDKEKENGIAAS